MVLTINLLVAKVKLYHGDNIIEFQTMLTSNIMPDAKFYRNGTLYRNYDRHVSFCDKNFVRRT